MPTTTVPFQRVEERRRIHFAWLIRLRWAAVVGQVVTVVTSHWGLGVALPLAPLAAIIAAEVAFNIACAVWARSGRDVSEAGLAAAMGADVLMFTGLLFFTGGPFNPFSFLYLVYIALAAVVLQPRWTWALAGLSLVCSAVLFVDARELPISHHDHMHLHLRGMWVALGVAAAFIVYFLMRVTRALAQREDELARARNLAARQEKLASLATLAAGAAHELSTPLSTIATVAKELERSLDPDTSPQHREDVELIRSQVDRCRSILTQMSVDAGESAGEGLAEVKVSELIAASLDSARPQPRVQVEVERDADCALVVPPRAVTQAIRGVIKNAQDASSDGSDIVVRASLVGDALLVEVTDRGEGMDADVLERVGEPFFTTKSPGRGMGLGLFLTRAVLERLGGALALESRSGEGTVARLTIPRTASATKHRIGTPA